VSGDVAGACLRSVHRAVGFGESCLVGGGVFVHQGKADTRANRDLPVAVMNRERPDRAFDRLRDDRGLVFVDVRQLIALKPSMSIISRAACSP
jgi:hypothetical protein